MPIIPESLGKQLVICHDADRRSCYTLAKKVVRVCPILACSVRFSIVFVKIRSNKLIVHLPCSNSIAPLTIPVLNSTNLVSGWLSQSKPELVSPSIIGAQNDHGFSKT